MPAKEPILSLVIEASTKVGIFLTCYVLGYPLDYDGNPSVRRPLLKDKSTTNLLWQNFMGLIIVLGFSQSAPKMIQKFPVTTTGQLCLETDEKK